MLMSLAEPLDRLSVHAHPAFARHRDTALRVLEVDAPVSPLLAGLFHPVLLLPAHIPELPSIQQQLIVEHGMMHLRRGDHVWQHLGALLQAVLWFIPSVHSFNRSLQWAMELGCDRAVLAGRSQSERRSYAAALLAQLSVLARSGQMPHGAPEALAFGMPGTQAVAERIGLIRDASPTPGLGSPARLPCCCPHYAAQA